MPLVNRSARMKARLRAATASTFLSPPPRWIEPAGSCPSAGPGLDLPGQSL